MVNKRKNIEELNLSDNFMFANVMSDKIICKIFLEKLLGIKIKEIKIAEYEKTIMTGIISKNIRIDVYVKDSSGKVYDIEMQNIYRDKRYNLAKRTRYYQSVIDTEELKSGMHYSELPESCIIFICTFDEFKLGKNKYVFRYKCDEVPELVLQNEAKVVILNTNNTDAADNLDEDIAAFLRYVENSDTRNAEASRSKFVKRVHKRFELVKKEKRDEYMTLQELMDMENYEAKKEAFAKGLNKGRKEGISKGIEKANLKTAAKLKASGCENVFTSEITGLPIETIEAL